MQCSPGLGTRNRKSFGPHLHPTPGATHTHTNTHTHVRAHTHPGTGQGATLRSHFTVGIRHYGVPVHFGATMGSTYIFRLLWSPRTFPGYYGSRVHFLTMGSPYICPLLWDLRTFFFAPLKMCASHACGCERVGVQKPSAQRPESAHFHSTCGQVRPNLFTFSNFPDLACSSTVRVFVFRIVSGCCCCCIISHMGIVEHMGQPSRLHTWRTGESLNLSVGIDPGLVRGRDQ